MEKIRKNSLMGVIMHKRISDIHLSNIPDIRSSNSQKNLIDTIFVTGESIKVISPKFLSKFFDN